MAFNLNIFKEEIASRGYIKSNLFDVWVTAPNIPGFNQNLARIITHRIEQVRVPGISFQSADISRYGVGPTQKQPYNAQFNEISFSIICDVYGDVWQFWHDWLRYIYDFTPYASAGDGAITTQANYSLEYKDNYSSTMSILIYDVHGNAVKRIDMYQAFPTAIKEVPMSWEDQNNLVKLGVTITFKEYTLVNAQQT